MRTGLKITLAAVAVAIVAPGVGLMIAGADGPLSILPRDFAPVALAGVATLLALTSLSQARRHRAQGGKLSREMDLMAERLLRLEARPHHVAVAAAPSMASTDIADLLGDVGILSRTVASLAETLSSHERDLGALKFRAEGDRARPDAAWRQPPEPPAPERVEPQSPPVIPSLFPAPLLAQRPIPAEPADPGARREAVAAALEAGRVELHLQPIVTLPQRRVRFYEALARLRLSDETVLPPSEFIPTLERLGRLTRLDGIVLTRAVAAARQLAIRGSEVAVSCNLSPASLREPSFLDAAERIITDDPQASRRLILEISQRSWRNTAPFEERVMRLSALGVAFALDRATDLSIDAERLARLGVRYAKLPADQLLAEDESRLEKLAAELAASGIQLVAERVEKEALVPELLEIKANLAQGFVFGVPRAVRSGSADAATAPELSFDAGGTLPEPSPFDDPPERLSLKSVLRRAG